jgi:predicted O-methyltransferase YrrM
LKTFIANNDNYIHSDKVIHRFSTETPDEINNISNFLNSIKDFTINQHIDKTKQYINESLMPIIYNCGEFLEGNIFMFHNTLNFSDDADLFSNKRKNITNILLNKNIKNVMEIGFNSGFSTLLMLISNPNIRITCFDLGEHRYTLPCFEKLKETFGDRLNIIIGDSNETLQNINENYDFIHIDGSHLSEVAESDIINSYRVSKQGTIIIMDDYDSTILHELWDIYIDKYNLKPLNINVYNSPYHDIKYVVK